MKMIDGLYVGILGIGRMGSVVARRLAGTCHLLLADKIPARARRCAHDTGARSCTCAALFEVADVILLLVPPHALEAVVARHIHIAKTSAILVNMVTDIATSVLQNSPIRDDVALVGAKVIGQANSLARGSKAVIILSPWNCPCRPVITRLFQPLGKVVRGDEMLVQRVNAEATCAALKFVIGLRQQFQNMGLAEDMIDAAVKTVCVGTILEYPPPTHNPYIDRMLKRIHAYKTPSR